MEVTGISVAKAQEIADSSIVDGSIDGSGNLVLENGAGATFNAGKVYDPLASWPVDSIYIGASNVNPATILGGGTWSRFGNGKVLVSQNDADTEFDTALETGGAKTHTLTTAQIPSHDHGSTPNHSHSIDTRGQTATGTAATQHATTGVAGYPQLWDGTGSQNTNSAGGHTHSSVGSGASHNNLQPYIVVYMWRRTA